ncbi:MAG: enolase [Chloroflexi bacterium]|nr:enolase [Chloroflexota bacterium]
MQITHIERIVVDAGHTPTAGRHMRRGLADWALAEVCKVTTDTGLVGWGETLPHYTWGVVTDAGVDRAMGANPADLLWDDSLGAGLQQALFDVVGQALGVPVHRLMGSAVRTRCPLAWWCYDMPPHDWASEARAGIEAGYTAFKLKARPWFDIVEQVEAVSAATPAHAKLDLDFNALLVDAGHAKPLLTTLAGYPKVAIFETPIPQTDIGGNRALRAAVPRPIAMHFDSPPFLTTVKEGVCDGFVVSGGAASCLHQGAQAHAANMPLWLQLVGTGITTAFAMHLGAVLPAARWPAISCLNTYAYDLLTEPLPVEHGYVPVPQAPGLGVTVDEDLIHRLRRPDASSLDLPRTIYTVRWADGRTAEYVDRDVYEPDFMAGNQPVFERGVTLSTTEDDGSVAFDQRFRSIEAAGCLVSAS